LAAALSAAALLTAALLTTALSAATLLTTALLTATLLTASAALSLAILLSALLSSASRSRLVWILLSVHDAFLVIELGVGLFAYRDYPFLTESAHGAIWTEAPNRIRGWSLYQAKSYRRCDKRLSEIRYCFRLALGSVTQAFDSIMRRFNFGELTGNKLLSCGSQTILQGFLVLFHR